MRVGFGFEESVEDLGRFLVRAKDLKKGIAVFAWTISPKIVEDPHDIAVWDVVVLLIKRVSVWGEPRVRANLLGVRAVKVKDLDLQVGLQTILLVIVLVNPSLALWEGQDPSIGVVQVLVVKVGEGHRVGRCEKLKEKHPKIGRASILTHVLIKEKASHFFQEQKIVPGFFRKQRSLSLGHRRGDLVREPRPGLVGLARQGMLELGDEDVLHAGVLGLGHKSKNLRKGTKRPTSVEGDEMRTHPSSHQRTDDSAVHKSLVIQHPQSQMHLGLVEIGLLRDPQFGEHALDLLAKEIVGRISQGQDPLLRTRRRLGIVQRSNVFHALVKTASILLKRTQFHIECIWIFFFLLTASFHFFVFFFSF